MGGQSNAHTARTLTVSFQGCNDLDAGAGRVWVDLAVGYSLSGDTTQSTWTCTGSTPETDLVDFDNWVQKRIRVVYYWDDEPESDHPGGLIVMARRKAL